MTDLDVRALQVKRLDEFKLATLHRRERERGYRLLPMEISNLAGGDLKKHYGVPERKRGAIFSWAGVVRQVVGRFCRERDLRPGLEPWEMESLHAFDDAVWHSDLDFHWRTATPAKKARDWFQS